MTTSSTHAISGTAVPPLLPTTSTSSASTRTFGPLAIGLICLAAIIPLIAIVVFAAGVFLRSRAIEAREIQAERKQTAVRRAAPPSPAPVIAAAVPKSNLGSQLSEPGVTYTNVRIPTVPWSVHVLKIDRSRKDLGFYSAHARDKVLGVSMLAEQARTVPKEVGRAIGAVNGDFYVRDTPTYAGDPRGLQILNGELISAPDTVCVWFDADGNPHLDEVKGNFTVTWPDGRKTPFGLNQQRSSSAAVLYTPTYGPSTRVSGGLELILEKDGESAWLPLQASQSYRARVREVSTNSNTRITAGTMVLSIGPRLLANAPEIAAGTLLQISTATTPDLKGVKAAIAGGPAIIKDGNPFSIKTPPSEANRNYSERSKYERHPRSAVGWSPTHVYLITVDGRQPGLSMGMKLAELAEFMKDLGCTDAMNLDGGKSAQMWLNGRIVNDPCQGEDTVANSLLVIRKADAR